ncbi:MAG: FKBP-type peptidyl-prolyl cis-trans isomerase [Candidatus Azobacteroides sp.]|nr:FKBP-type peptidyl-prolyl cis-trans isomerase [Candidatus Azobacteroides sp.]
MKNLLYLFIISALFVSFGACKNDDKADDAWREANTDAYEAITKNPAYQALQTETGPTGVYYKVIQSGTGTEYPLQTSNVEVLYKGTYYDGTVFDSGTSGSGVPMELSLGSLIRGFSFALQNMTVGDKWEIWVPYYLGYGESGYYNSSTGQTIIQGYTTLVFEVELVSITLYP